MREKLFINNTLTLKNCIPLKFLNKIFKSKIYVNKITGSLIFKKFYNEEKNLKIWEQKYFNAKKKEGKGYIYKSYSSVNPYFLGRHVYVIEFLKNFLKELKINSKNMKFADIGCGNATLLYLLSQRLKYKKIIGFDYSSQILRENVKNFKNNKIKDFAFIKSSAEKINKKFHNYFDVVLVTWTLSSCSDPLATMKKIYKLLKKNGIVVVAESSRILVYPSKSIYSYFSRNYDTGLYYPWRFSFNSLKNILTYSGLLNVANNKYKEHNDLIIISKKTNFQKKYTFDNYRKVINFFKIWLKKSQLLEKNKLA